ncbi:hypothetical protein PR202_gb27154 [Eleusine coracana subsp. coracana]|uniref:Uncharacterized protein n=1 Tax=Eleusine coracana subsp. coracana TaxID=191504 RepID=A0AAV5FUL3_ELECO|nr:hypothetical protein PR202_gb27154 [Eleusine coracana subsp. coracana]
MLVVEKNGQFSGEETIAEFEQLTRDAAATQREVLRRILSENAAPDYLRELGLAGCTDPESFRACVPVVTHEDLEPYIMGSFVMALEWLLLLLLQKLLSNGVRIIDGDTSPVLTLRSPRARVPNTQPALGGALPRHLSRCPLAHTCVTMSVARDMMVALLLVSPTKNPTALADEVARTCDGLVNANWYGVIPGAVS